MLEQSKDYRKATYPDRLSDSQGEAAGPLSLRTFAVSSSMGQSSRSSFQFPRVRLFSQAELEKLFPSALICALGPYQRPLSRIVISSTQTPEAIKTSLLRNADVRGVPTSMAPLQNVDFR